MKENRHSGSRCAGVRGAQLVGRGARVATGGGRDVGLQNLKRTVHRVPAEQRAGVRSIQAQAHLARGMTGVLADV